MDGSFFLKGRGTILNALRGALRIFSGKIIFISRLSRPAGRSKRIFTGGNSLSQSLTALPAPSWREPLAKPEALRLSRKLYRNAKGPILEDDFPRPGEDVTVGDKKGNLSSECETGGVQQARPLRHGLRRATSPKGRGLGIAGSFPV